MNKIKKCALALAVFSCWIINTGYAEQPIPERKFKSWTVETKENSVQRENSTAYQWKKNLAASAAKKQAESKKQASVQNAQVQKESLKAAVKEKHRKDKQKKNNASSITIREKGHVTYNDGWRMKTAQLKLRRLGYMSEPATGKMTPATKQGLEKFQKELGYNVTGKLDDKTYRKLEWVVFSKDGIKNLSGDAVIREASKYKGVRYLMGGTTPKGFDCSGYVQYVFKQLHAQVSRTADTQALEGVFVTQRQLEPGDLVFFSTYEPGASHCGIYAGNGKFWNATSSRGIMLCGLHDDYWRTRYYGARRLLVSNGEPKL